MKTNIICTTLLTFLTSQASAQTVIEALETTDSTLTGIEAEGTVYNSLVPATSVDAIDASTDYLHVAATPPLSLAAAISDLQLDEGSLNTSFQVQFEQTLFGSTLVYLLVNEANAVVQDSATVYPIDADGNRIREAQGTIRFLDFGEMSVLSTATYNRTTDGTFNGSLDRILTGMVFTLDDLGIGNLAGTQGLEFVTTDLDPQEIGLARAGSLEDPTWLHDVSDADPDFDFGILFPSEGSAPETPERTVRFLNGGPNEQFSVNAITATSDFTITDISINGTSDQTPPFTLAVGDSLAISAKGTPTAQESASINGAITIESENSDLILEASATFLRVDDRLNANPTMISGGATAEGWSDGHARVSPGLSPGSQQAIRIFGVGDASTQADGEATQSNAFPPGIDNFESVFIFTPVSDFATYADSEADGGFTDRSFQYRLLGPASEEAPGILIDLAYLPDGANSGETPGFYVFDSISETWQLALAMELTGSTDSNLDGVLDVSQEDTVEACRVSLTGTGFGQTEASYQITVSQVDSSGFTDPQSSPELSFWHDLSGEEETIISHSFTATDTTIANIGDGFTTPFWVDFAGVYYGAQPDGVFSLSGQPETILANQALEPTGTTTVSIRNEGDESPVTLASAQFTDPSFSFAESLPLSIDPGQALTLNLEWDSSQVTPNTAANSLLTLSSGEFSQSLSLLAGVTSIDTINPNANFEVLGQDAEGDSDSFAFWNEGTAVQDIPGLVNGSQTAAHVNGNNLITTDLPITFTNWSAKASFAIGGTNDRIFNFKVRELLPQNNYVEINIRYEADKWQVFDGVPSDEGAWSDLIDMTAAPLQVSTDGNGNGSLNDPGDTKIPYQIQISATGWNGTSTPSFSFEILDADGQSLGTTNGRTELLRRITAEDLPALGPDFIEIRNTGADFWIDDVVIAGVNADAGITITNINGGPGNLTLSYEAGGQAVNIQRSTQGLQSFEEIASGETAGTFTDSSAPSGSAFYRVELAE
jgi:hypothetical protein